MDTFKIIDLPFNSVSLTAQHVCDCCKEELVSLVDIELKKTFINCNIAS